MAEQNLESDQTEGSSGTTNSVVSQGPGDQLPSTFSAEQLLTQLRATIVEEVGKAVQSTKDRRFSEIEKTLGGFQPVLERFKDFVTPEQLQKVQHDLEWEEVKRRVFDQSGVNANTGNVTQSPAIDAAQVIRDYGLDMNDPKVALLASRQYQNADEVDLAIARHIKAQRQAPSPTPAQTLTDVGNPPESEGLKEKTQKYKNDVRAARGRPDEINRLREQAIRDGIKTWEIDFT